MTTYANILWHDKVVRWQLFLTMEMIEPPPSLLCYVMLGEGEATACTCPITFELGNNTPNRMCKSWGHSMTLRSKLVDSTIFLFEKIVFKVTHFLVTTIYACVRFSRQRLCHICTRVIHKVTMSSPCLWASFHPPLSPLSVVSAK